MRVSQLLRLGIALLLLTETLSACTMLRTPYEKAKIQENGGVVKKQSDQAGSDRGGGDEEDGGKKKQAGAAQKKPQPGKAETALEKSQREQKEKSRLLALTPKLPTDTTPKMAYSKGLSAEVARVEGVEGATVLLNRSHDAYVAIHSSTNEASRYEAPAKQSNQRYDVKTEGEVPTPLQMSIAKRLRAADPLVETVYITNDPHHVATIQRYANQVATGRVGQLNAEALTEHIEDIWK